MADINQTLNLLATALTKASNDLALDKQLFDDNTDLVNEYLRQIAVHQANGSQNDANNVSALLNNTYILRVKLQNNLADSQLSFDTAKNNYDSYLDGLTPAQRDSLTAETQTQLVNATANALKVKADADKQNFASKNVQYFIIGAIVLTIIIVTIVIIRKRKKSRLVQLANVSNIRPFIQKWEGGLSKNPNDTASSNPAPCTYKGVSG